MPSSIKRRVSSSALSSPSSAQKLMDGNTHFISTMLNPSLVGLAVALAFGLAGCSSNNDAPNRGASNTSGTSLRAQGSSLHVSQAALRLLDDVRAHFIVPASPPDKLRSLGAAAPDQKLAIAAHPLIGPSEVQSYQTFFNDNAHAGYKLVPRFSDGARAGVVKPSKVRLGRVATDVAQVQDEQTGAVISVRWLGAKQAPAESAGGYLVYRDVLGMGSAALTRADITGAEQYVRLPAGGPKELRYEIVLGDIIAGLRQVQHGNSLEFLDKKGTPRLRMTAPVAVAGSETVPLRLDVVNCTVDTSPKSPWGRAVTDPGKRRCVVTISWKKDGDVLVDPVWATTGDMTYDRSSHTASKLKNGQVLVVGDTSTLPWGSNNDLYDPNTGTWANTAKATESHTDYYTASVLDDGRVFVLGSSSQGNGQTVAELYDPSNATWKRCKRASFEHYRHTASVLHDGSVLIAGGLVNDDRAEVYDVKTDSWTTVGNMIFGRYAHTASVLNDGRVLVAGGRKYPYSTATSSVEIYAPKTKVWTAVSNMTNARGWHAASVLHDGRVLVVGGYQPDMIGGHDYGHTIASTELYDPTSDTWSSAGDLAVPSDSLAATVINTGLVLISGGSSQPPYTCQTNVEAYDPSSNTWHADVVDLSHARTRHTSTLLDDGRVLVAGGYDGKNALRSAVLFTMLPKGAACTGKEFLECESNHCVDGVCCDTACTNTGYQCIQSRTGQPDGTCSPVMNGVSCSSNDECGSGFCVEQVCCNTSCTENCQACSAATKESGPDGICGPAKANTDPHNDCDILGSGVCKLPGVCDGHSACVTHEGTVCGQQAYCSSTTTVTPTQRCDATGACKAATAVNCLSYVCRDGACLTSCTSSDDCVAPRVCIDSECRSAKGKGSSCDDSSQCASQQCVDDVCCDKPCKGLCESCDGAKTVSGSPGTCSPIRNNTDPDDECSQEGDNICGRNGFCNGAGSCAVAPSTKICGSECSGNASSVAKRCSGTGQCEPITSTTKQCEPYTCSPETGECKTRCTSNSDCVAGVKCDPESGQCVASEATCSDEFTLREADGTEHDCTPYKCSGSTCRDSCVTSTDCAHGFECVESRCVVKTGANNADSGASEEPKETSVNQDTGCGCSIPGRKQPSNAPSREAVLIVLGSIAVLRRRRRN